MRQRGLALALCASMLVLAACSPFFYGGVVVFGPADDPAPAEPGGT